MTSSLLCETCQDDICYRGKPHQQNDPIQLRKMFKIPDDLLKMPGRHQYIELDGCKIIESCHHEDVVPGTIYINQRVLICILSGKLTLELENGTETIEEGQVVLLNKNVYAPYCKFSSIQKDYASVLFFIEDKFIQQFLANRELDIRSNGTPKDHFIARPNVPLLDFIRSVLNLFYSDLKHDKQLLQLKVNELLIHLASLQPGIVHQLFSGAAMPKKDLVETMENNYLKYASLEEFAYMSGRSLATFKRDFKTTFKTTPAKWLRSKRMTHAKHLLKNTHANITDIYSQVGFMNYSHFSRAFKEYFGYSPSQVKKER